MPNRDNWKKTYNYYQSIGLIPLDAKPGEWVLHHIDPTLQYRDKKRYNQCNIYDVIPVPFGVHTQIHHIIGYGKEVEKWTHTEESKQHYSEAAKKTYENGKTPSALGKHWFNNGETETYQFECPEGFIKGRLPGQGGYKKKRYAELTQIESVRTEG